MITPSPVCRLQLRGQQRDPAIERFARRRRRNLHSQRLRQAIGEARDGIGRQREPVIGAGAGQCRHRFDRIETVHRCAIARGDELARIAQRSRQLAQEIGIERDDDFRRREAITDIERLAENEPAALERVVRVERVVLMPARFRVLGEERVHLTRERGRGDGFGEQGKPPAAVALERRHLRIERRGKRFPGREPAALPDGLRAIRIPQLQHRSLGKNVGAAEARGMRRIAFDLGRAPEVAFDQHTARIAAQRHCRGEKKRLPGNELLRRVHVGHDRLLRRPAARRAGERPGGGHQLEETAAIEPFVLGGGWPAPTRFQPRPVDGLHGGVNATGHSCSAVSVIRRSLCKRYCTASACRSGGVRSSFQRRSKTRSRGRTRSGAWRWQSRHHCISSECSRQVSGI